MNDEIITVAGRFNDDQSFKNLEAAAYFTAKNGTKFNFENLSANEYKYFSQLIQIYQDFESKHLSQADAEKKKASAYAEYEKETNAHLSRIIDNLKWRDNVKTSEDLRQKINKTADVNKIAALAIECISLMAMDESFLKSNIVKLDKL